jgi:hypothetical protein
MHKLWWNVVLLLCLPPSFAMAQSWLDDMAALEAQIEMLERQRTRDELLESRAAERAGRLPQVLAVVGRPGHAQALIGYGNGRVGRHGVGDELIPGIRVVEVAPQGVRVTAPQGSAQRELWLAFAAAELPLLFGSTEGGQAVLQDAVLAAPPRVSP